MRLTELAVALLIAFVPATTAYASAALESVADYSLQSWDERQGLPAGRIWAITQDAAGYLWLGTESGLVRFDGARFVRWTANDGMPLPEELIVFSLLSATDGSLWLGFAESGGVGRIQDGRLTLFDKSAGIGDGPIHFLLEDRTGTIWAGDSAGVSRFRDGRWEGVGAASGILAGSGFDAHEDRSGNLWISTSGGVSRRPPGQADFEPIDRTKRGVRFSEDSTGRIWVTDPLKGFAEIDAPSKSSASAMDFSWAITHDRTDSLWLGTQGQGLWRVGHDSNSEHSSIEQITVTEGLSSNIVRSLFEDREGNVWVGTESALHRFTARKITPLTSIGFSWAAQTTPDGSVWIATNDGLVQFKDQTQRRYGRNEGLPSPFVRALATDARGTLWVATDHGVARRVGDRFQSVGIDDARLRGVISVAADSRGNILLCDRLRGAFIWANGRLTELATPQGVSGVATFVYVDRRDRTWAGFRGGVVASMEPGGSTKLYAFGGAIGSIITAAYEDHTGAMWLGGTRGVGRIKGDKMDAVGGPNGFPGYGVVGITEDADGYLWLGISSGILRLSVADFEKAAGEPRHPLSYRFYDASDGLVGVPVRAGFPGAIRRADGTLWFLTSRGASVIKPRDLDSDQPPARVRIESVRANDGRVLLSPMTTLPPGTSRLLFEYTAVNLTSPMKERFQYRLEGADSDWVDAGTRREAFYPNLRSGHYRFQVTRLGNDRAVNEPVASWEFSIQPMFYQTWWFTSACVAIVGLMGWTAWQMRVRQLRRQFALVFAERARMSRDLHDTLLQDLAAVALHCDEVATSLGTSFEPATNQLIRLRRYLERAVSEARQVVWDLRSTSLEDGDLPKALREVGARTFGGKPSRFTMIVTGSPRRCLPAVEQHLLRIAQEALRNAARYADASLVQLSLEYRDKSVVLRVSDDGCGFQPAEDGVESPGHYGFVIMKERAEQAGGEFRVETILGKGTEIDVIVPSSTAG